MVPVRAGPGHLEDMAKWRRVNHRRVGGFLGEAFRTHPALEGDPLDPQAVAGAAQRLQQGSRSGGGAPSPTQHLNRVKNT